MFVKIYKIFNLNLTNSKVFSFTGCIMPDCGSQKDMQSLIFISRQLYHIGAGLNMDKI